LLGHLLFAHQDDQGYAHDDDRGNRDRNVPAAQRRSEGARARADLPARRGKDGRIEVRRRRFMRGFAVQALEPGIAFRAPVRTACAVFVQRHSSMPRLNLDIA
jgi:hypothetical protein